MTTDQGKGGRPELPSDAEIANLPPDGGPRWNRLIFESSPYLLQHAANPVDWYPWGEEAFQKARNEDKPVFLSVGYATCHWCHVMEHECFEDVEVAALMNRHFVSIKVDKEERPDIDDIYMAACLALNGHGGWPLSAWLTHDREPFFTGTYFPKHSQRGRVGMLDLVPRVGEAWHGQRKEVLHNARLLTRQLQQSAGSTPGEDLGRETLDKTFQQLAGRFDREHGGFGGAPKFPSPHNLLFLLRYWKRSGRQDALDMVSRTLAAMSRGGLFDHVGFGFHRYATDDHWLLPHFEKMLYDQAMLALAYVEGFHATGEREFARTASAIFTYVTRDLTSPEGGFYSAEDADSEGVEGKFYLWREDEVPAVLGEEDGTLFNACFQILPEGNFREEATGRRTGENIPHLPDDLEALAKRHGLDPEGLRDKLEACRRQLFEVREKRIHPLKDDKILTDWNGLMIAAFAMGARVLEDEKLASAARAAADFLLRRSRDDAGRLFKRYRRGKAGLHAVLDDYAYFIWGLLELYAAVLETDYLEEAIALTKKTLALFGAQEGGGFYLTSKEGEPLITRSMRIYDGATPSGNSVMAANLARLAHLTGETHWRDQAEGIVRAFSGQLASQPISSVHLMSALDFLVGPTREVVIAGERGDPEVRAMIAAFNRLYLPETALLLRSESDATLTRVAPFASAQKPQNQRATAYVCRDFTCHRPTNDVEELVAQLMGD